MLLKHPHPRINRLLVFLLILTLILNLFSFPLLTLSTPIHTINTPNRNQFQSTKTSHNQSIDAKSIQNQHSSLKSKPNHHFDTKLTGCPLPPPNSLLVLTLDGVLQLINGDNGYIEWIIESGNNLISFENNQQIQQSDINTTNNGDIAMNLKKLLNGHNDESRMNNGENEQIGAHSKNHSNNDNINNYSIMVNFNGQTFYNPLLFSSSTISSIQQSNHNNNYKDISILPNDSNNNNNNHQSAHLSTSSTSSSTFPTTSTTSSTTTTTSIPTFIPLGFTLDQLVSLSPFQINQKQHEKLLSNDEKQNQHHSQEFNNNDNDSNSDNDDLNSDSNDSNESSSSSSIPNLSTQSLFVEKTFQKGLYDITMKNTSINKNNHTHNNSQSINTPSNTPILVSPQCLSLSILKTQYKITIMNESINEENDNKQQVFSNQNDHLHHNEENVNRKDQDDNKNGQNPINSITYTKINPTLHHSTIKIPSNIAQIYQLVQNDNNNDKNDHFQQQNSHRQNNQNVCYQVDSTYTTLTAHYPITSSADTQINDIAQIQNGENHQNGLTSSKSTILWSKELLSPIISAFRIEYSKYKPKNNKNGEKNFKSINNEIATNNDIIQNNDEIHQNGRGGESEMVKINVKLHKIIENGTFLQPKQNDEKVHNLHEIDQNIQNRFENGQKIKAAKKSLIGQSKQCDELLQCSIQPLCGTTNIDEINHQHDQNNEFQCIINQIQHVNQLDLISNYYQFSIEHNNNNLKNDIGYFIDELYPLIHNLQQQPQSNEKVDENSTTLQQSTLQPQSNFTNFIQLQHLCSDFTHHFIQDDQQDIGNNILNHNATNSKPSNSTLHPSLSTTSQPSSAFSPSLFQLQSSQHDQFIHQFQRKQHKMNKIDHHPTDFILIAQFCSHIQQNNQTSPKDVQTHHNGVLSILTPYYNEKLQILQQIQHQYQQDQLLQLQREQHKNTSQDDIDGINDKKDKNRSNRHQNDKKVRIPRVKLDPLLLQDLLEHQQQLPKQQLPTIQNITNLNKKHQDVDIHDDNISPSTELTSTTQKTNIHNTNINNNHPTIDQSTSNNHQQQHQQHHQPDDTNTNPFATNLKHFEMDQEGRLVVDLDTFLDFAEKYSQYKFKLRKNEKLEQIRTKMNKMAHLHQQIQLMGQMNGQMNIDNYFQQNGENQQSGVNQHNYKKYTNPDQIDKEIERIRVHINENIPNTSINDTNQSFPTQQNDENRSYAEYSRDILDLDSDSTFDLLELDLDSNDNGHNGENNDPTFNPYHTHNQPNNNNIYQQQQSHQHGTNDPNTSSFLPFFMNRDDLRIYYAWLHAFRHVQRSQQWPIIQNQQYLHPNHQLQQFSENWPQLQYYVDKSGQLMHYPYFPVPVDNQQQYTTNGHYQQNGQNYQNIDNNQQLTPYFPRFTSPDTTPYNYISYPSQFDPNVQLFQMFMINGQFHPNLTIFENYQQFIKFSDNTYQQLELNEFQSWVQYWDVLQQYNNNNNQPNQNNQQLPPHHYPFSQLPFTSLQKQSTRHNYPNQLDTSPFTPQFDQISIQLFTLLLQLILFLIHSFLALGPIPALLILSIIGLVYICYYSYHSNRYFLRNLYLHNNLLVPDHLLSPNDLLLRLSNPLALHPSLRGSHYMHLYSQHNNNQHPNQLTVFNQTNQNDSTLPTSPIQFASSDEYIDYQRLKSKQLEYEKFQKFLENGTNSDFFNDLGSESPRYGPNGILIPHPSLHSLNSSQNGQSNNNILTFHPPQHNHINNNDSFQPASTALTTLSPRSPYGQNSPYQLKNNHQNNDNDKLNKNDQKEMKPIPNYQQSQQTSLFIAGITVPIYPGRFKLQLTVAQHLHDKTGLIGSGGFGAVKICTDIVDGGIYAVKQVVMCRNLSQMAQNDNKMNYNNNGITHKITTTDIVDKNDIDQFHKKNKNNILDLNNSYNTQSVLQSLLGKGARLLEDEQEWELVLREARCLAKLDHQHVVRYYNCWLEYLLEEDDVWLDSQRKKKRKKIKNKDQQKHKNKNTKNGKKQLDDNYMIEFIPNTSLVEQKRQKNDANRLKREKLITKLKLIKMKKLQQNGQIGFTSSQIQHKRNKRNKDDNFTLNFEFGDDNQQKSTKMIQNVNNGDDEDDIKYNSSDNDNNNNDKVRKNHQHVHHDDNSSNDSNYIGGTWSDDSSIQEDSRGYPIIQQGIKNDKNKQKSTKVTKSIQNTTNNDTWSDDSSLDSYTPQRRYKSLFSQDNSENEDESTENDENTVQNDKNDSKVQRSTIFDILGHSTTNTNSNSDQSDNNSDLSAENNVENDNDITKFHNNKQTHHKRHQFISNDDNRLNKQNFTLGVENRVENDLENRFNRPNSAQSYSSRISSVKSDGNDNIDEYIGGTWSDDDSVDSYQPNQQSKINDFIQFGTVNVTNNEDGDDISDEDDDYDRKSIHLSQISSNFDEISNLSQYTDISLLSTNLSSNASHGYNGHNDETSDDQYNDNSSQYSITTSNDTSNTYSTSSYESYYEDEDEDDDYIVREFTVDSVLDFQPVYDPTNDQVVFKNKQNGTIHGVLNGSNGQNDQNINNNSQNSSQQINPPTAANNTNINNNNPFNMNIKHGIDISLRNQKVGLQFMYQNNKQNNGQKNQNNSQNNTQNSQNNDQTNTNEPTTLPINQMTLKLSSLQPSKNIDDVILPLPLPQSDTTSQQPSYFDENSTNTLQSVHLPTNIYNAQNIHKNDINQHQYQLPTNSLARTNSLSSITLSNNNSTHPQSPTSIITNNSHNTNNNGIEVQVNTPLEKLLLQHLEKTNILGSKSPQLHHKRLLHTPNGMYNTNLKENSSNYHKSSSYNNLSNLDHPFNNLNTISLPGLGHITTDELTILNTPQKSARNEKNDKNGQYNENTSKSPSISRRRGINNQLDTNGDNNDEFQLDQADMLLQHRSSFKTMFDTKDISKNDQNRSNNEVLASNGQNGQNGRNNENSQHSSKQNVLMINDGHQSNESTIDIDRSNGMSLSSKLIKDGQNSQNNSNIDHSNTITSSSLVTGHSGEHYNELSRRTVDNDIHIENGDRNNKNNNKQQYKSHSQHPMMKHHTNAANDNSGLFGLILETNTTHQNIQNKQNNTNNNQHQHEDISLSIEDDVENDHNNDEDDEIIEFDTEFYSSHGSSKRHMTPRSPYNSSNTSHTDMNNNINNNSFDGDINLQHKKLSEQSLFHTNTTTDIPPQTNGQNGLLKLPTRRDYNKKGIKNGTIHQFQNIVLTSDMLRSTVKSRLHTNVIEDSNNPHDIEYKDNDNADEKHMKQNKIENKIENKKVRANYIASNNNPNIDDSDTSLSDTELLHTNSQSIHNNNRSFNNNGENQQTPQKPKSSKIDKIHSISPPIGLSRSNSDLPTPSISNTNSTHKYNSTNDNSSTSNFENNNIPTNQPFTTNISHDQQSIVNTSNNTNFHQNHQNTHQSPRFQSTPTFSITTSQNQIQPPIISLPNPRIIPLSTLSTRGSTQLQSINPNPVDQLVSSSKLRPDFSPQSSSSPIGHSLHGSNQFQQISPMQLQQYPIHTNVSESMSSHSHSLSTSQLSSIGPSSAPKISILSSLNNQQQLQFNLSNNNGINNNSSQQLSTQLGIPNIDLCDSIQNDQSQSIINNGMNGNNNNGTNGHSTVWLDSTKDQFLVTGLHPRGRSPLFAPNQHPMNQYQNQSQNPQNNMTNFNANFNNMTTNSQHSSFSLSINNAPFQPRPSSSSCSSSSTTLSTASQLSKISKRSKLSHKSIKQQLTTTSTISTYDINNNQNQNQSTINEENINNQIIDTTTPRLNSSHIHNINTDGSERMFSASLDTIPSPNTQFTSLIVPSIPLSSPQNSDTIDHHNHNRSNQPQLQFDIQIPIQNISTSPNSYQYVQERHHHEHDDCIETCTNNINMNSDYSEHPNHSNHHVVETAKTPQIQPRSQLMQNNTSGDNNGHLLTPQTPQAVVSEIELGLNGMKKSGKKNHTNKKQQQHNQLVPTEPNEKQSRKQQQSHKKPIIQPQPHGLIFYLQMQYCSYGTLRTYLDSRKTINPVECFSLFEQMLLGLHHIHQLGLIHRDLKPDNIFFDELLHIRIGDFGLCTSISNYVQNNNQNNSNTNNNNNPSLTSPSNSLLSLSSLQNNNDTNNELLSTTIVEKNIGPEQQQLQLSLQEQQQYIQMTGGVGSYLYAAPEQIKGGIMYTNKCDMFSIGIILFELFNIFTSTSDRIHSIYKARAGHVEIDNNNIQFDHDDLSIECMNIGGGINIPLHLQSQYTAFLHKKLQFEQLQQQSQQYNNNINNTTNNNFNLNGNNTTNFMSPNNNLTLPPSALLGSSPLSFNNMNMHQLPSISSTTTTSTSSSSTFLQGFVQQQPQYQPHQLSFDPSSNLNGNNNNNTLYNQEMQELIQQEYYFRYEQELDEIRQVISNLLSPNPSQRFSCEDILKSKWFRKQQLRSFNHGHFR